MLLKKSEQFAGQKSMYAVAPLLFGVFFVLLLFMHRSAFSSEAFLSIVSHVVKEGAPFALLACGGSLVIAAGSIDLSIVGTISFSGALFAVLTQQGVDAKLAAILCTLYGSLTGFVLGWLVSTTKSPALILSWSIGVIGLLFSILLGGAGIVRGTPNSIPLGFIPEANFWDVSSPGFLLAVGSVVVAIVLLNWSNFPQFCCALGASPKGALYAGIDAVKVLTVSFLLNGMLAALAGVLWALLANSSVSVDHIGKELVVIAVSVLGGTSLSGGYISLWSVAASALFWSAAKTLVESMDLALVGGLQSEAATGIFALVLIAVVLLFSRNLSGTAGSIIYKQNLEANE